MVNQLFLLLLNYQRLGILDEFAIGKSANSQI